MPASEKKPPRSPDRWLVEHAAGKLKGGSPEASEAVSGRGPGADGPVPSDEKKKPQEAIGPEASKWLVAAPDENGATKTEAEDHAKGAEAEVAEQWRRPMPAADVADSAGPRQEAETARLAELVSSLQSELKLALARADEQAGSAEAATNQLEAAELSSQELEKNRNALERVAGLKAEADAATERVQAQAARAEETLRRAERAAAKEAKSTELQEALEKLKAQRAENRELEKRFRELETNLRVQAKEAKTELKRALKDRESELRASLEERETELTRSFEERENRLRAQIEDLETKLAEAKKRAKPRARKTSTAARKAPAKTTSPRSPTRSSARSRKATTGGSPRGSTSRRRQDEKLDLNDATFEDLRALGLSVTQSARLIAYRDVREGYKSLDELGEIPGLSKETRAELRAQLKLSG